MFNTISLRLVILLSLCSFLIPQSLMAKEPPISVKTERGWVLTIYTITLDKERSVKFRDALDKADTALIGAAYAGLKAPHPAVKIAVALATANVNSFKRAMTKEGAIGAKGVTITIFVLAGILRNDGWDVTGLNRPVKDAVQALLNPWSWSIKARE